MPQRARQGFTLVELLVAIVLIDAGLLALAGATGMLVRRHAELHARNVATSLAANRLQSLAASPCGHRSGSTTTGAFTESWSDVEVGTAMRAVREVRDSVRYSLYRIDHSVVLVTRLPC